MDPRGLYVGIERMSHSSCAEEHYVTYLCEMDSLREEHVKPYLNGPTAAETFGSQPVCVSFQSGDDGKDYNDVKVRRSDGTWRLSDRDAGSPRRAGVKCHCLSGGHAAGVVEIMGQYPPLSFSNPSPFLSCHRPAFLLLSSPLFLLRLFCHASPASRSLSIQFYPSSSFVLFFAHILLGVFSAQSSRPFI